MEQFIQKAASLTNEALTQLAAKMFLDTDCATECFDAVLQIMEQRNMIHEMDVIYNIA